LHERRVEASRERAAPAMMRGVRARVHARSIVLAPGVGPEMDMREARGEVGPDEQVGPGRDAESDAHTERVHMFVPMVAVADEVIAEGEELDHSPARDGERCHYAPVLGEGTDVGEHASAKTEVDRATSEDEAGLLGASDGIADDDHFAGRADGGG